MGQLLEPCFAKVRRAEEQLAQLEKEFWPSPGNEAYRAHIEHERDSRQYRVQVRVRPESWLRWSVIIGEIAHDLRSALDQAVCVAVRTVRPSDKCGGRGFPIRGVAPATDEDRRTYEATVEHVPPKTRALIDRKQPHTAPTDADLLDLLDLNLLNRWDKHRALPLLVRAFWGHWDSGTPEQPIHAAGFWHVHDPSLGTMEAEVALNDGTHLYTYEFVLPPNVSENAQITPLVSLDESGPIKRPLIESALRSMCAVVRTTLEEIEATLT